MCEFICQEDEECSIVEWPTDLIDRAIDRSVYDPVGMIVPSMKCIVSSNGCTGMLCFEHWLTCVVPASGLERAAGRRRLRSRRDREGEPWLGPCGVRCVALSLRPSLCTCARSRPT